jgi:hypothetical protein
MTIVTMYVICGILSTISLGLSIHFFITFKSRKRIKQFFIDQRKYSPGRMALVKNWRLKYDNEDSFGVDYDVEITNVTESQVKVQPIDFKCSNTKANDPINRSDIMSHMVGKWLDKRDVQLVVDISTLRNDKLEKILKP